MTPHSLLYVQLALLFLPPLLLSLLLLYLSLLFSSPLLSSLSSLSPLVLLHPIMSPSADPIEALNALSPNTFTKRFFPPKTFTLPSYSSTTSTKHSTSPLNRPVANTNPIPTLILRFSLTLEDTYLSAALDLIRATSCADYAASSIGWSPSAKRAEMLMPAMRYILLVSPFNPPRSRDRGTAKPAASSRIVESDGDAVTGQLYGFVSFMFTYEEDLPVIYLYEIHLQPQYRGLGYGQYLIQVLERAGREAGMEKLMLTVFEANIAAKDFYARLGFEVDEISPQGRVLRSGKLVSEDYAILSKDLIGVSKRGMLNGSQDLTGNG